MSASGRDQDVGAAAAARALGGLPLEPEEARHLEEIAGPSRAAVATLYAIDGIRYAEPAVVFRLGRPASARPGR